VASGNECAVRARDAYDGSPGRHGIPIVAAGIYLIGEAVMRRYIMTLLWIVSSVVAEGIWLLLLAWGLMLLVALLAEVLM
jgi:hypothetical protein